jgi:hypothetical protein
VNHAREHEHEPHPGLPESLPAGERLLWQGAPDWRVLARRGFRLPWFAAYFALLLAWRFASTRADGGSVAQALGAVAWTLPLVVATLGFVALLAWLVARTTLYTLTDRRVVMRIGVVLSVSFNLPLVRVEAAQLRRHADGSGDIALRLHPSDRIGVMHLWPHARPWRFTRTEPMLRALPEGQRVAGLLVEALTRSLREDERAAVVASTATGDRPTHDAPRGTVHDAPHGTVHDTPRGLTHPHAA